MKAELIHQKLFENDIEAVAHIVEFTEFYNRERLHSGVGYHPPKKYEKLCAYGVHKSGASSNRSF